jgi:hypothetical protein
MHAFKLLLRQQIRRIGSIARGDLRPEQEAVYQAIVDRDLRLLSIPNRFYPVNSAANYSLLYLLLRSAQEFEIKSLVELGSGQTSVLIEHLRQKGLLNGTQLTIEQDAVWSQHIASVVTHKVVTAPLLERSDAPRNYSGYDFSTVAIPAKIDCLIIDGPVAAESEQTFARLGALPLLEYLDGGGYVIIVDDAEREGERLLVTRIAAVLSKKGHEYKTAEIRAAKKQVVFASGRMRSAAFY